MKHVVRHTAKASAASRLALATQAPATPHTSAASTEVHAERNSVFCIATRTQADRIVADLKAANFSSSDISVVAPDTGATHDFANGKQTKAAEGTIIGAGTGGFVGAALGWIVGLGTLATLGCDPWIVGLGVGVLGAAVLGLAGGRVGRSIPHVKGAGILIAVHARLPGELARAKSIFTQAGAQDGHARGEATVLDCPPPAWARLVRPTHAAAEPPVETAAQPPAEPPRHLRPSMPEWMPRPHAGHLEPALAAANPARRVDAGVRSPSFRNHGCSGTSLRPPPLPGRARLSTNQT